MNTTTTILVESMRAVSQAYDGGPRPFWDLVKESFCTRYKEEFKCSLRDAVNVWNSDTVAARVKQAKDIRSITVGFCPPLGESMFQFAVLNKLGKLETGIICKQPSIQK